MKKRVLFGVVLLCCIGVIFAVVQSTYSWFASGSTTGNGNIGSAIVSYAPSGKTAFSPINAIRYGNLQSGSYVDMGGVAHILPADQLLPAYAISGTGDGKVITITTSSARTFESTDVADSTIVRHTKSNGTAEITQIKRTDVAQTTELSWVPATPLLPEQIGSYTVTSTFETKTVQNGGVTTKTATTTTVYTPKDPKDTVIHTKTEKNIITTTVLAPQYQPAGGGADFASAAYKTTMETKEDILHADSAKNITQFHMTITKPYTGTKTGKGYLPLSVGNKSTITTDVRTVCSATITRGSTVTRLTARDNTADASYCLGVNTAGDKFIELFNIKPAGEFKKVAVSENTAQVFERRAILPAGGNADANSEVLMPAISSVEVAAKGGFVTPTEFENLFNELYCTDAPKLNLKITYYAKQQQYMEWKAFHTYNVQLQLG